MIELLLLGAIFLISGGLGKKVFSVFKFKFGSFLEELLFSAGLGLGLLSIFTFLLGILKLLYPLYAYLLLFASGLLSYREIVYVLKNLWESRKKIKWGKLSLFNKAVVLILAFSFFTLLISTYNPPVDGDVILYHLAVPKIYLKNGAITYIPYNFFSCFPFFVQTLFTLAMLLRSDLLAQQIHLLYGVLAALSVYLFARKYYSFNLALLACAIFVTIPSVFLFIASIAFVDLALAFYFNLAVYSFFKWRETKKLQEVILTGLLAGFTAASKPQGFIAAFLMGLIFVFSIFKLKIKAKEAFKVIMFYACFTLFVPSFWLVKNFYQTGNPFFPFFYGLFGGRNWDALNSVMMTKLGLEQLSFLIKSLPYLPWALTMEHVGFHGKIGPVFLAFLPGAFISLSVDKKTRDFFLLSFYFFFGLLFSPNVSVRYLSPILPLVSVLTALGAQNLLSLGRSFKTVTCFLLLFSFFTHSLVQASYFLRPPGSYPPAKSLKVVFGFESREQYLSRVLPYYKAILFVNDKLPQNSKVLILGGRKMGMSGYYFDRDYIWGSPLYQAYINYWKLKDAQELYREYKRKGVTHIFFEKDPSTLDPKVQTPFIARGKFVIEKIREVLTRYTRIVYEDKKYRVYQLI